MTRKYSPTVRLSIDTVPAIAGQPCTINLAIADLNNNLASGTFDWGDGTPKVTWTTPAPLSLTHTYAKAGTYQVLAEEKDTTAMRGSATASITVNPPTPLPIPPPPAPPPVVSVATLTASPATINQGQSSILTLTLPTTDYHNIFITVDGVDTRPTCVPTPVGAPTPTGSSCTLQVTPAANDTYVSKATNAAGVVYTMPSVSVTVIPVAPPPPPPGTTIVRVPAGGNIQAALNAAASNTEIRIAPSTYLVNLVLPAGKTNITLRSDVADSVLGTARIAPSISGQLAILQPLDGTQPIIATAVAATGYTLRGLEIGPNTTNPASEWCSFGSTAYTSLAQVPDGITVDQCYIHAGATTGGHRGIALNVKNGTVTRCYISGFWEQGRDSQAINVINGPGPFTITDNYLEASGENILFGGGDPKISGLIPSDIVFRNNTCFKPLSWKTSYPGSVKNIFELKNAQRVLVEYNTFQNCWIDGQSGHGIVLTVRNQDGTAPWTTVKDVTIRYNTAINFEGMFCNILGQDDTPGYASVRGSNFSIHDNLATQMGNGFQIITGPSALAIYHNTILGTVSNMLFFDGLPVSGFSFLNNVMTGGLYGANGTGTSPGTNSIQTYAPSAIFTNNVIDGNVERVIPYPAGNFPLGAGQLASQLDAQNGYIGPQVSTDGPKLGANIAGVLPLVQASNFVKLGRYNVPVVTDVVNGTTFYQFDYAVGVVAYNPANNSLFYVGHDQLQWVAELSIPASFDGTVGILQPFTELLYGKGKLIDPDVILGNENYKLGGLYVQNGVLAVAAYTYYDGAYNATASHFSRSTTLSNSSVTGPLRVGSLNPGFYGGYFCPIPANWQAALGGDMLVGLNGVPNVARTSYGPSAHAITLANLQAGTNPTPAVDLLYYDQAHQTLGQYGIPGVINKLYNGTAKARGLYIPPGTASLLFFGNTSQGPYCYGEATNDPALNNTLVPGGGGEVYCYDPVVTSKGEHGYPYGGFVWAYNLNDLAQVKLGNKQPWEILPYASWDFAEFVSGLTFDPATNRIYITAGADIAVYTFQ